MKILAIETSCDETAIALVEAEGGLRAPRFRTLKNIVSSQIKIHAPYGGVVPNLAKREHIKNLPVVLRQVLEKSKVQNPNAKSILKSKRAGKPVHRLTDSPIDLIAVTIGPGLEPALWTGIEFAKNLAKKFKKSLAGANHLEGHLYSFLFSQKTTSNFQFLTSNFFPAIGLIVSGGHTILVKMDSLAQYQKIGETRDDAAGEAFDKVARMLGLPYPGGPEIEKLAARGNPSAILFPRPMLHTKTYDFSFSGLKTAVLYYLRDMEHETSDKERTDVAASFQQAAIDVLVQKTMRAAQEFGARSVMLSGGVAANQALRQALKGQATSNKMNFFVPPATLNTDNAVMIAGAAYINYLRKKRYRITAQGNLNL